MKMHKEKKKTLRVHMETLSDLFLTFGVPNKRPYRWYSGKLKNKKTKLGNARK